MPIRAADAAKFRFAVISYGVPVLMMLIVSPAVRAISHAPVPLVSVSLGPCPPLLVGLSPSLASLPRSYPTPAALLTQ